MMSYEATVAIRAVCECVPWPLSGCSTPSSHWRTLWSQGKLMSDRRVNLRTADKDKSTSVRLALCRAEQGIVGATSHTLIIGKGKQSETLL